MFSVIIADDEEMFNKELEAVIARMTPDFTVVDDAEDGCTLQVADETASVLLELERKELRARLEKAMDRLPVHLKELFVWRHISGLSYEEMAEIKNLPVGTVKNRVFQAKEMMRGLLEETS